ncbi:F-box protein of unknown function [Homalodisca vitripennis]|nr:F-box protein of unknown function [Homalodisca vitripennis]
MILQWLPKRTLSVCAMVCQRWRRVVYDESLWERIDLTNQVLRPDQVGYVLQRNPAILRMSQVEWRCDSSGRRAGTQLSLLPSTYLPPVSLPKHFHHCHLHSLVSLRTVVGFKDERLFRTHLEPVRCRKSAAGSYRNRLNPVVTAVIAVFNSGITAW